MYIYIYVYIYVYTHVGAKGDCTSHEDRVGIALTCSHVEVSQNSGSSFEVP